MHIYYPYQKPKLRNKHLQIIQTLGSTGGSGTQAQQSHALLQTHTAPLRQLKFAAVNCK